MKIIIAKSEKEFDCIAAWQIIGEILNKPEALELVLTGRDPADYMIEAADYVTEMKKIKHL